MMIFSLHQCFHDFFRFYCPLPHWQRWCNWEEGCSILLLAHMFFLITHNQYFFHFSSFSFISMPLVPYLEKNCQKIWNFGRGQRFLSVHQKGGSNCSDKLNSFAVSSRIYIIGTILGPHIMFCATLLAY